MIGIQDFQFGRMIVTTGIRQDRLHKPAGLRLPEGTDNALVIMINRIRSFERRLAGVGASRRHEDHGQPYR